MDNILDNQVSGCDVGRNLHSPYFCRQLQIPRYDDLFAAMSPETFMILLKMTQYSAYFLLPLFRTQRADLLRLVDDRLRLSHNPMDANILAEQYLGMLAQLDLIIDDASDETQRLLSLRDAVRNNQFISDYILSSSVMFHRLLDEENEALVHRCFSLNLNTYMHWQLSDSQKAVLFSVVGNNKGIYSNFINLHQYFPDNMLYEFVASEFCTDDFWKQLEQEIYLEPYRYVDAGKQAILILVRDALKNNSFAILERAMRIAYAFPNAYKVKIAACLLDAVKPHTQSEFRCIGEYVSHLLNFRDDGRTLIPTDILIALLKCASIKFLIQFCQLHLRSINAFEPLCERLLSITAIIRSRHSRTLKEAFCAIVMDGDMAAGLPLSEKLEWLSMIPTETGKEMIRRNGQRLTQRILEERFGDRHPLTQYAKENQKSLESGKFHWANSDVEKKMPNAKRRRP